jgi:predicted ATPase
MLLRFSFSNFLSFQDEHELSLIATGEGGVSVSGLKESVLQRCAIYGANASGKSNVLRALHFVEQAVLHSHRRWEPEGPIPLETFRGNAVPEAGFLIDFVVAEVRFQFQFKATKTEIVEEHLVSYPNGRKQTLYTRSGPAAISFGRALPGDNKTIAALMRPNSLFLSVAAQNNHEFLRPVYAWFQKSIHFRFDGFRPGLLMETIRMCAQESNRREISDLLKFVDLGVDSLTVDSKDVETGEKVRAAMDAFFAVLEVPEDLRPNKAEKLDEIKLIHRFGSELVAFDLDEESQGTISYLTILGPVLRALQTGSVLVVDEIDSSLHPDLVAFLVRLFGDPASNPKLAQLIFNTHDTNLLADGVLRRDEVWFTEKKADGASKLYPLSDFKPRPDENFQKRYLQGRFGAVPFINSERIVELLNANATS